MKNYLFIFLLVGVYFAQNYSLNQYVLSSSAINSTNSQRALTEILGQLLIGESQNSNNILFLGFWDYISYGFLETDELIIPKGFQVINSYPNPFNPVINFNYYLHRYSIVSIIIYDMLGDQINSLEDTIQSSGYKSVQWNATDSKDRLVSSRVYICTIKTKNFMHS